ncbi:hypothetical protein TVAG_323350 [Trichomonas vaginalis G3]|uniref:Uncharacterized protein n=1 Tax=Trichomonas vaginalis (strain ATCC PRA-98 / G3) TaxID=412133 RepID=A2FU23_TRIV3|nr:armadillo (ARM) repeat-containing protein family [Trichomonas vaginalis G3]EAX91594.1 hypothetical protein TVAG_323350 [Trichomonas vaginalis G3]KAI5516573.1 armadillo (ARM) repeat-containing protein family [Trichomonas vaginalis G3]|eukprot:XP_001304524.1 hypothetical protein [Trichomonas vaginalis G3]
MEIIGRIAEFVAGDPPKPLDGIDNESIWEALINTISNDKSRALGIYFNVFAEYADKCPEFRQYRSKSLDGFINIAFNQSIDIEQRKKAFSTLIILIPFLPRELIVEIIVQSLQFFTLLVEKSNKLPLDFISFYEDLIVKDLASESREVIMKTFIDNITNGNSLASLSCFGPICEDMFVYFPNQREIFTNTMDDFFSDSLIEKSSAVLFLKYYIPFLCEDGEYSSQTPYFIETLDEFLAYEDETITKLAFQTFLMLIKYDFINETTVDSILLLVDKYTSKLSLKYFFQILSFYSNPTYDEDTPVQEDECNYNMEVVSQITTFCTEIMVDENKSPLLRGFCIDLLSNISEIDFTFVEPIFQQILKIIQNMIQNKLYESYYLLSSFLVTVSRLEKSESSAAIDFSLPEFVDSLENGKITDIDDQCALLSDICTVISEGFGKNDLKSKILKICFNLINNENHSALFAACNCIIFLRQIISQEAAKEIFNNIYQRLDEMDENKGTNMILHTLRKLMTKFGIDIGLIEKIIIRILSGDVKALEGKPPTEQIPPDSCYFMFVQTFIEKLSHKSPKIREICSLIINLLETVKISSAALMFPIVNACINSAIVDRNNAAKIVVSMDRLIQKIFPTDATEIFVFAESLFCLSKAFNGILKPAERYFKIFVESAMVICQSEKDEEIELLIQAMPTVSRFILSVCADNDTKWTNTVENAFNIFSKMMPFDDKDTFNELLSYMITISQRNDLPKNCLLQILKVFTKILLMDKRDTDEYEVTAESMMTMKNILKKEIKSDEALSKIIIEDFKSSRSKVARFNAMIR